MSNKTEVNDSITKEELLQDVIKHNNTVENDVKEIYEILDNIENEIGQKATNEDLNYYVEDIREKIIQIGKMSKSNKENIDINNNDINNLKNNIEKINTLKNELKSDIDELLLKINNIKTINEKNKMQIKKLKRETSKYYKRMNLLAEKHISLQKEFKAYKELQELKNKALFNSIQTGVCENCGEKITIYEIKSVHCPQCNKKIYGFEDNLFYSNKINVK